MKRAEVVHVFRKQDTLLKKNYRPVSVLPTLSKLFEKLLATQLSDFFENIFNCLMSAYRKRYNCQDVLLKLVESWRHDLDNKNSVGSVMMDLSRTFDSMPRGLLLAKLRVHGVDVNACRLLYSYLSNRRQRVKLCNTRSDWIATYRGVPQGSGLGPLLYNNFGNDLFYFINTCSLYNYADDNTLSYSHTDVNDLIHVLKTDCKVAIEWFTCNYMKANPDKFQVLFLSRTNIDAFPDEIVIDDVHISRCKNVKLLGVTIDDKLKFDDHVSKICAKASQQLNTLIRIRKCLTYNQRFRIYDSFILSNFNFCPIVWHYCSVKSTRKMENIQKRALRFLTDDKLSNYTELLHKTKIPSQTLQRLKYIAIEIFKCLNNLNLSFMSKMFNVKENKYDMRKSRLLELPVFKTVSYGKRSFLYNGCHLWNQLPDDIRNITSLSHLRMY